MSDFRAIALGMPSAVEQAHFGSPSFRVEGKIFAQLSADGETGLVKLPPGAQEWALDTYPEACTSASHWGKHGWTHLAWRELPQAIVADFVTSSWRSVAPKALLGSLSD